MSAPRILIVDDERSLLLTLGANLELEGMEVTTAESGRSALALIERQPFDLVLSDVRMPGMSGVEMLEKLADEGFDLPVVVMSGHADSALAARAINAGARMVIDKPFREHDLLTAIRQAMAGGSLHRRR